MKYNSSKFKLFEVEDTEKSVYSISSRLKDYKEVSENTKSKDIVYKLEELTVQSNEIGKSFQRIKRMIEISKVFADCRLVAGSRLERLLRIYYDMIMDDSSSDGISLLVENEMRRKLRLIGFFRYLYTRYIFYSIDK